jgi:hypothetical protein
MWLSLVHLEQIAEVRFGGLAVIWGNDSDDRFVRMLPAQETESFAFEAWI